MVVIGGFRFDLSITQMIDGNFGNVSAGVLIWKVAYQGNGGNLNNTKIYKDLYTLLSTIHKSSRLIGSELVIQKKSMQNKLISRELYTAAMQEIIHTHV